MLEREKQSGLTAKINRELAWKAHRGDLEARAKLIERHMDCVETIVSSLRSYIRDYDEAYQEGMLALIEATDNFDVVAGYSFTNHVRYAIYNATIKTIVRQNIAINIKNGDFDLLCRAIEKYKVSKDRYGIIPTVEELASTLQVSTEELLRVLKYFNNCVSLDELLSHNTSDTGIVDNYSIDDIDEKTSIKADVDDIPNKTKVNDKQWEVIKAIYGIDADNPVPQTEIAKEMNISRTRVDQLKKKGFERVINSSHGQQLADYLGKKIKVTPKPIEEPKESSANFDYDEEDYIWELNQKYERHFIDYTPDLSLYLLCVDSPVEEVQEAFAIVDKKYFPKLLICFDGNLKQRFNTPERTAFCAMVYEEITQIIMNKMEQIKADKLRAYRAKREQERQKKAAKKK